MYKRFVMLCAAVIVLSASGASAAVCPPAPAVASAFLRELDMRPKAHDSQNIYAMIASYMGQRGSFDGIMRCDAAYEASVRSHIVVE